MSTQRKNYRDSRVPVPEQAAEWLVQLAEPALEEASRRQFITWLKTSPRHIEEFLAIAVLQQEVAAQSGTVAEIVAELRAADQANAVALFAHPASTQTGPAPGKRRRLLPIWASAAALALIGFFLLQLRSVEAPADSHRTERGEQRSILLSDGSIVTLNTLSEAAVRFDHSRREVTLVAGEAMFDVVADPDRPFIVETGAMSLKVVGTKFSVYRRDESSRLAVVEGSVDVSSRYRQDAPVVVRAGEGVTATANGLEYLDRHFDVAKAIAWTERRLIFDGAPLADVVREFNRYNRTPLIVEDPALAGRAITTVFNANDVSALVGFLELEPDVEVEHGDDAIRIRARR
ncbi:MAG: FecR domain-containing protein [Woeseia sp.]